MIWLIALVLFCFMTGHSAVMVRILQLIAVGAALIAACGAWWSISDALSHDNFVLAFLCSTFAAIAAGFVAFWGVLLLNALILTCVESILNAIRG